MTLPLSLGHTTLEVTQMYAHLAEERVKLRHPRLSLVARRWFCIRSKRWPRNAAVERETGSSFLLQDSSGLAREVLEMLEDPDGVLGVIIRMK